MMLTYLNANIWDNVFSQYDSPTPDVPQEFSQFYEMNEFRLLKGGFWLDFDGNTERIAINFTTNISSTPTSVLSITLDFLSRRIQAAHNSSLCWQDTIPSEFIFAISDMNTALLYLTFSASGTSGPPSYTFSLSSLLSLFSLSRPSGGLAESEFVVVFSKGKSAQFIVPLLDERLSFTERYSSARATGGRTPFDLYSTCESGEHALNNLRQALARVAQDYVLEFLRKAASSAATPQQRRE